MVVKHLAGVGADHALGTAVQELGAQFLFKLAQLLGQGGLCNMQYQCGPRQRSVVDDGNKIAQLAKFHIPVG